jgi:hypothetical protein
VGLLGFTPRPSSASGRGSAESTGSPDDDLGAACDRLSEEIAVLRRALERERLRLASLRRHGIEPRGLLAGLLAGGAIVVAGFFAVMYAVGSAMRGIG